MLALYASHFMEPLTFTFPDWYSGGFYGRVKSAESQVVLGTAFSPFFPITSCGPFCLSSAHLQLVNPVVAVSLLLNRLFFLYVKQGPRECQA